MNKWLFSLVALVGLGVSASEAQYYRPPTYNSGIGLYGNPYLRGGYPQGMYGGGYPQGMYGGNALFQPGMGVGNAIPGQFTGQQLQLGNTLQGGELLNPSSDNITGHPTRFNSYSRYFFNQGGLTSTTTPTGSSAVYGLSGTDPRRNTAGSLPQQGPQQGQQGQGIVPRP